MKKNRNFDFNSIITLPLRVIIWLYKYFFSPLIGANCRFQPSCSSYAEEALRAHGFLRGCYLIFKRIIRCNPYGDSGYDPVPSKEEY